MKQQVKIEHIGRSGDGITHIGDKKAYVPYVLEGEIVEVEQDIPRAGGISCTLHNVLEPSPHRTTPPCPHFTACGGCHMQHMSTEAYRSWKLSMLQQKIDRAQLDITLKPLLWENRGTRKRATFHFQKKGGKIIAGFHAPYSNDIVDIQSCAVLTPELWNIFERLKEHAHVLCKATKRFSVLLTLYGKHVDAAFTINKTPSGKIEKTVTELQQYVGFTQTSIRYNEYGSYDVLVSDNTLNLSYNESIIPIPSGSFSQATYDAENIMQERVYKALKGTQRIADLFCGSGTFTLPFLKSETQLTCVDITYNAVRALSEHNNIVAQERNLFTHPLAVEELNSFDAVIIDPPRAGAKEQCKELAKSTVKKIVMISCDSSSFVRDAQILTSDDYKIRSAELVDQFIWSPHSEIISIYEK